ncbi:MAG: aminopeptidase [Bacteroidia bacterium]
MKKIIFLIVEILFLILVIFSLVYRDLVEYGWMQGEGQLEIYFQAKPVSEMMNDKNVPDSIKNKLNLVQEIRQYAIDSLGINDSKNFTSVYNQHGKPSLWVLTAAEKFSLRAKAWNFPFLGNVSYKGFFDLTKGKRAKIILENEGYDTDLGMVSDWSTLGWLNDPILSNTLSYHVGDLSNLIIHELTHGTLYVKNNVDFNENLASFIGDKGALKFLQHKYGKDSEEYLRYVHHKSDRKMYADYILKSAARLDSLYKQFKPNESDSQKEQEKMNLIQQIIANVSNLNLYNKAKYIKFSKEALISKNAFFVSFKMYDSQYDFFDQELHQKFGNNLRNYLDYLKKKYPSI